MAYIVTMTDSEGEGVCGRFSSLAEAKQHISSVRYSPAYSRRPLALDLSSDGMTGTGYDEDGHFTYEIKAL